MCFPTFIIEVHLVASNGKKNSVLNSGTFFTEFCVNTVKPFSNFLDGPYQVSSLTISNYGLLFMFIGL